MNYISKKTKKVIKVHCFKKISVNKLRKLLFTILILAVFLLLLLFLLNRNKKPEVYEVSTMLQNTAALYLNGSSAVGLGESFILSLYLDTNSSAVAGLDIVLNFDPSMIRLENIAPQKSCSINVSNLSCFRTFYPIIDTDYGVFDLDRVKNCANQGSYSGGSCSQGKIEFGAAAFDFDISNKTNNILGNGLKIADLQFTSLASGTTNLNFDYTSPNITTDTNVVAYDTQEVDDVLATTQGMQLTISSTPQDCNYYDLSNDGRIGVEDIINLLNNWDIHSDNLNILLYILQNWGANC